MQKSLTENIAEQLKLFAESDSNRQILANCTETENLIRFKGKEYHDFASNDYLNLSHHPALKSAASAAIEKYGVSMASSQLITGHHKLAAELETRIAHFKKKEAALIFNSGYVANLGLIQALAELDNVHFLLDRLVHASIIDATRASKAKFNRFRHNDMFHLEELIKKNETKTLVVIVDSVYSMEGDEAPVEQLIALKNKYKNLVLYIDEAHGTGVFGPSSRGLTENYENDIDIIMGTFSKGLGSFGAYAVFSADLRAYIINKARSFVYTTALPPAIYASNIAAIDLLEKNPTWGSELLEKSVQFRLSLNNAGLPILAGRSQIISIILKTNAAALAFAKKMQESFFWLTAIRSPTVPKNTARVRITLHKNHKNKLLNLLSEELVRAYKEL